MSNKKYRNKYRIASTRLRNWDYGWNATYFVTICTKNRICFFGNVVKMQIPQMQLNEIGKIVETEWQRTFKMRPDMNLEMGEFVVMPNHFHALIGIGRNKYNSGSDMLCKDRAHPLSVGLNLRLQQMPVKLKPILVGNRDFTTILSVIHFHLNVLKIISLITHRTGIWINFIKNDGLFVINLIKIILKNSNIFNLCIKK